MDTAFTLERRGLHLRFRRVRLIARLDHAHLRKHGETEYHAPH